MSGVQVRLFRTVNFTIKRYCLKIKYILEFSFFMLKNLQTKKKGSKKFVLFTCCCGQYYFDSDKIKRPKRYVHAVVASNLNTILAILSLLLRATRDFYFIFLLYHFFERFSNFFVNSVL